MEVVEKEEEEEGEEKKKKMMKKKNKKKRVKKKKKQKSLAQLSTMASDILLERSFPPFITFEYNGNMKSAAHY
jgi:hypothetical protein